MFVAFTAGSSSPAAMPASISDLVKVDLAVEEGGAEYPESRAGSGQRIDLIEKAAVLVLGAGGHPEARSRAAGRPIAPST